MISVLPGESLGISVLHSYYLKVNYCKGKITVVQ